MADYLLSVRRVRKQQFDAEPGRTKFLEVPGNRLPTPAHAIRQAAWVDAVMAEGLTHTRKKHNVASSPTSSRPRRRRIQRRASQLRLAKR
jgi:hypothetical protein